ncbi:hypothetical protein D6833_05970, partial [Candidatus Parcubacteria bacterium]
MANEVREWLRLLSQGWLRRIEAAKEVKRIYFQESADILWGFLRREYDDLYILGREGLGSEFSLPTPDGPYYRPRLNKCQEFVALMLPHIAARVPTRTVEPRRPQLPPELSTSEFTSKWRIIEEAAKLLEWLLNYTPREFGLETELRHATQEALVKGRGCLWHELVDTPYGTVPGSFYDTVDNLLVDPDALRYRDAGFIVRRRVVPAWV